MIGLPFAIAALLNYSGPPLGPSDNNGNRNIRVVVDYNFITGATNHWESTGAFVDEGVLGDGAVTFRGRVEKTTDDPHGQYGTFTWKITKNYTPGGNFGDQISNGSWEMIGGTGKYEGISGNGILKGRWNGVTGTLHDEFEGKIDCPKC